MSPNSRNKWMNSSSSNTIRTLKRKRQKTPISGEKSGNKERQILAKRKKSELEEGSQETPRRVTESSPKAIFKEGRKEEGKAGEDQEKGMEEGNRFKDAEYAYWGKTNQIMKCDNCKEQILKKKEMIRCHSCEVGFHGACVQIEGEKLEWIKAGDVSWFCSMCKENWKKYEKDNQDLRNQVEKLTKDVGKLAKALADSKKEDDMIELSQEDDKENNETGKESIVAIALGEEEDICTKGMLAEILGKQARQQEETMMQHIRDMRETMVYEINEIKNEVGSRGMVRSNQAGDEVVQRGRAGEDANQHDRMPRQYSNGGARRWEEARYSNMRYVRNSEVTRDEQKREERRSNLVMYNVEEVGDEITNPMDRKSLDIMKANQIITEGVKVTTDNYGILNAIRLGKREVGEGNRKGPRPLLVKLRSKAEKWKIIQNARNLKDTSPEFRKVGIDLDLDKDIREQRKGVYEEFKRKRDSEEGQWVIRKGRVVPRENLE